jgi:uncharacterized iron-regulated membrane protein
MSVRKILFWLHLTAGSLAGIVILIMSLTGTLLMYEKQITAWADRALRHASPGAGARRLPMETLLAKAAKNRTPQTIVLHSDPSSSVELTFGREQTIFVNAYTGDVLGEASTGIRSFFRFVEDWHRWLGAAGDGRAGCRGSGGPRI